MMPERTIKGSGGRRGGSVQTDNHFFDKTKVDGEEIRAFLDTGASANCIGRGADAF